MHPSFFFFGVKMIQSVCVRASALQLPPIYSHSPRQTLFLHIFLFFGILDFYHTIICLLCVCRNVATADSFAIDAQNLSYSVVSRQGKVLPILKDCSLKIPSGQFWMLLGPNGCGKSTLLKANSLNCLCKLCKILYFLAKLVSIKGFGFCSFWGEIIPDISRFIESRWWVLVCGEAKELCVSEPWSSGVFAELKSFHFYHLYLSLDGNAS